MKRQDYYPTHIAEQVAWLQQFAREAAGLTHLKCLNPERVAGIIADALWLAYLLGGWRTGMKSFVRAAPAYLEHAQTGKGAGALALLMLTVPPLPAGVVPRPPGALKRIFNFVRAVKGARGYGKELGSKLGLLPLPNSKVYPKPTFKVQAVAGVINQVVRIRFSKRGRQAVVIESRLVDGEWIQLGTYHNGTMYDDDRPLRVPGQPELREYRLRFFEDGHPTGEWTTVARVTVGP